MYTLFYSLPLDWGITWRYTAIIGNAIAIFRVVPVKKGDVTMTSNVQAQILRIDFFYASIYCEVACGQMIVRFWHVNLGILSLGLEEEGWGVCKNMRKCREGRYLMEKWYHTFYACNWLRMIIRLKGPTALLVPWHSFPYKTMSILDFSPLRLYQNLVRHNRLHVFIRHHAKYFVTEFTE